MESSSVDFILGNDQVTIVEKEIVAQRQQPW